MGYALDKEQLALRARAREVAEGAVRPRAAETDRGEQYPWDNVRDLTEAGFFGMTISEAYGGAGRSYLDAAVVVEEMARVCGVTGRIAVEANMGAIGTIMEYGTEEQKRLAADLVLAGDKPAICITEPDAGSAATEMTTRADRRGNGYVLNGKKHWITGAGVSRLHLIFARVFDETEGLVVSTREPTMGLRGIPEAELLFQDMVLPADMAVIPPRGLRKGFADLMNAYNAQRVGAATVALGLAQGAYDLGLAHIRKRASSSGGPSPNSRACNGCWRI